MFDSIGTLLKQQNILNHSNHGITICFVRDQMAGVEVAKQLFYTVVDRRTAVYLSGGRTPKDLYEMVAKEETLLPGAVGIVDERFGDTMHDRSNEKMMKETGLLRFFELRNIPFYPMLQNKDREKTADLYDEKVRSLHATFQRSVALLGIGSDGHTAGIAGNRKDFKNPLFDKERQHLLVSEFNDEHGMFKERVTMTFLGLSMMDLLVVLVFGDDKKEALEWMFNEGSEEEIPARFYKRPDISQKTIIITDQAI